MSIPAPAKRMGARERLWALKWPKRWGLGEEEWRVIPTCSADSERGIWELERVVGQHNDSMGGIWASGGGAKAMSLVC